MLIWMSTNISLSSVREGSSVISRFSSSELFSSAAILARFDVLASSSVEPRSPRLCFPLIVNVGIGKPKRYLAKN